jgi:hypothetical protein
MAGYHAHQNANAHIDIDRNNASQARLAGFEADLGLEGQEFATVLSIVYGKSSMDVNCLARR